MQISYELNTDLEKFGGEVYHALRKNFSQTFLVGGMVRDIILKRPISDIDIATDARPEQTVRQLQQAGIECELEYARFGVIGALKDQLRVEVTTLRTDLPSSDRYADVTFITSPEQDSLRRDFTLNALYLEPDTGTVLDFHKGLTDIENKLIRVIGNPDVRFAEDPLRIIRAMRFSLQLEFNFEKNTMASMKRSMDLLSIITKQRMETEIHKIKDEKMRAGLEKLINSFA